MVISLIGFVVLLALILVFRVPIAFALATVGFVGYTFLVGLDPALARAAEIFNGTVQNYSLAVVPLFILMGNLVSKAGLSHELYAASHAFLGHRRGGLAMATIVACGGFSAICGSSLATAATMSKVALPPMRKYGYDDSLATASIASGGTLGILIPPSVILVIYGFLTETSIRDLFTAGFLPGLLGVLLYLAAVRFVVWRKPEAGPKADRTAWPDRWRALMGVFGTVVLFLVVIGGIYGGLFTPNEAAGIGAFGALVIALAVGALTPLAPHGLRPVMTLLGRMFGGKPLKEAHGTGEHARLATLSNRELNGELKRYGGSVLRLRYDWRTLYEIFADTARTSAMLFTILIGAIIFAEFVNRAGLPAGLQALVTGQGLSAVSVMLFILLIYIVLGCVFESLSMLLLTIPVFFPIVVAMAPELGMTKDETAVWFGIISVVVTEISLITPPVGLNVFVLASVLPDVRTSTIFRGVTPFWTADILRLGILLLLPTISLILPTLIFHCDPAKGWPYSWTCPVEAKKQGTLRPNWPKPDKSAVRPLVPDKRVEQAPQRAGQTDRRLGDGQAQAGSVVVGARLVGQLLIGHRDVATQVVTLFIAKPAVQYQR